MSHKGAVITYMMLVESDIQVSSNFTSENIQDRNTPFDRTLWCHAELSYQDLLYSVR